MGGILPGFTPLGKQRKQKGVGGEAGLQDWGTQPSQGRAGAHVPAGMLETLAVNEISLLSARESQASVLAPGGDLFGESVYIFM